jgi:hypothetical protein
MSQTTIDLEEGTQVSEEDSKAAPSDQDGLQLTKWHRGVDRYRETAKWAIGAFAAIGVVLAGSAPLAGISGTASDRGWALFGGAILGLAGVGGAIASTVSMLVPRTVYWHEVRAKQQGWFSRFFKGLGSLEDMLARYPDTLLPNGIRSVRQLDSAIDHLSAHVGTTSISMEDHSLTDAQRTQWKLAHGRYKAQLKEILDTRDELMLTGIFEKARVAFRLGFAGMIIGALLAGAGLGLVLYGSRDATEVAKAEAEVAKIKAETKKIEAEAANVGTAAP